MNIKILKIVLIIASAFLIFLEGLYLFALPAYVNSILADGTLKDILQKKTGMHLFYDMARIKTYPDFSIRLVTNNFLITDTKNNKVTEVKKLDTSIYLPSLIFKKLSLKALKADNAYMYLSREKDNKIHFGDYPLTIAFKNTKDINADLNGIKIRNSSIILEDKLINQKINAKIDSADFYYKKNKTLGLVLNSKVFINDTKKSSVFVNYSSRLPFEKGLKNQNFVCDGYVKNLDLSDYSSYFSSLSNQDVLSTTGIINAEFNNQKDFNLNAKLQNLKIVMKNPLDSVVSNGDTDIKSTLNFSSKTLGIKSFQIKAKDWTINIDGSVKNYTDKNPRNIKLDLNINVPESNIHSMYWISPSIDGDPQEVIQKFKKYGAWGKAKGCLQIKGNTFLPEVYGDMDIYDVYIVKNNPLVPHCKIFVKFLKDKVKVTTRVWAGYGEYVDVDGIGEMKVNGKGDFHVVTSKNVDLSTAAYMLVPIHEVVGFDLGPVPYMQLKGKGDIDIYTKGSVIDGEVVGQFNFRNTTASLDGLNTVLHNANGVLDFDHKNMHFYTKSAYIKNKPLKIDGKADLAGNIDFDVTSNSVDVSELFDILNTSSMLDSRKIMAEPIEKVSGSVDTSIKIIGIVKDFGQIMNNKTLEISGNLKLKNASGKLKALPITLEKMKGVIDFDNIGWKADLTGYSGSSKLNIKGFADNDRIDVKFGGDALKIDELVASLSKVKEYSFLSKLPKTHSLVSAEGEYKSSSGLSGGDFSLENVKAKGLFKPISSNQSKEAFGILNGSFILSNGDVVLKNFNAKLFDSKLNADAKITKMFSKKPVINGSLDVTDFDISAFDSLKKMNFITGELKKLLNAYENYHGTADASVKCRDNRLDGYVNLKNINFNHSYFKTPVVVDSGKILLDGSKITLKSMIAQVDNTPVFLNFSVWDFDKTMKFSGYFTTKLTEYFANKYINSFLTYPIKPKGDITFTADVNGSLNAFKVRPKIKFAPDADLYYMGADLGDESDVREIAADINVENNTYYLKKMDYIRYMTSQNDRTYPMTILNANGIFEQSEKNKKSLYIRNLNVETLNNANDKIFNVIFKKSVLKNGMFNCKLNIKGDINNPIIRGKVSMENIDMPLYDTIVKDIAVKFKDKTIELSTNGLIFNSDFKLNALMRNKLSAPFVVEKLEISSDKLNLDTFIDSLTRIPTPDTTTKMAGATKTAVPVNVSDVQIKKGTMDVKDIIIRGLPANNYTSEFTLGKDMVLNIDKLWFDVTTGKMTGTASYNFANGRIKANVAALNVDSNKVASKLFEFKDQIFGQANGNIVVSTKGNTEEERIKNMSGYVYFEIADGKMPKLGYVEYLLKAGNFIKSGITGASISNFLDLIAPIKTGYFDSIKGNFALKNGVAQNIEVYSKGDNLNIYINGEYDILQQYANLRVFGRLTKKATNLLGAVGNLSFNSLLNAIPGFKLDKTDKMTIIQDLNKIPGVELSDKQYRVFTVKIDGHINEEKFVKNFRWIE